jgi:1-deoxy-D-xylulose-5-phosphate reductoisomerase
VAAFLDDRVAFAAIPAIIEQTMEAYERAGASPINGLDEVRSIDGWAREFAARATAGVQSAS